LAQFQPTINDPDHRSKPERDCLGPCRVKDNVQLGEHVVVAHAKERRVRRPIVPNHMEAARRVPPFSLLASVPVQRLSVVVDEVQVRRAEER